MRRKMIQGQWLISGLLVMMLASACVQPTGDQLQPTGFAQIATFTLPPSNTPAEIVVTSIVMVTPEDFGAQDVDNVDDTDNVGGAEQDPFVAQVPTATEPLTEDQLLSTAIIEGATQTSAALTATFQPPLVISTETPTVDLSLPIATNVPAPGTDCIDEVRAGDNLFRISQRYGLTVADIAARNGITNVDLIFPGQMLTIPACGTTGYVPLPTSTPTSSPVVNTTGGTTTAGTTTGVVDQTTTGGTNGMFITFTPPPGGTTGTVPTTGQCGSHVILEGESLFQIATANGTTVAALASANGIVNPDAIDMGDTLVIPC